MFYKNVEIFTWRVSDFEELVGLPYRRDADPWRSIQAQIHLTTFCIDGWALLGVGPPQTEVDPKSRTVSITIINTSILHIYQWGYKTDSAFQRYILVTEDEMGGMKWLDQKKNSGTIDT